MRTRVEAANVLKEWKACAHCGAEIDFKRFARLDQEPTCCADNENFIEMVTYIKGDDEFEAPLSEIEIYDDIEGWNEFRAEDEAVERSRGNE